MDPRALAAAFPQWTVTEVVEQMKQHPETDDLLATLGRRCVTDQQLAQYMNESSVDGPIEVGQIEPVVDRIEPPSYSETTATPPASETGRQHRFVRRRMRGSAQTPTELSNPLLLDMDS